MKIVRSDHWLCDGVPRDEWHTWLLAMWFFMRLVARKRAPPAAMAGSSTRDWRKGMKAPMTTYSSSSMGPSRPPKSSKSCFRMPASLRVACKSPLHSLMLHEPGGHYLLQSFPFSSPCFAYALNRISWSSCRLSPPQLFTHANHIRKGLRTQVPHVQLLLCVSCAAVSARKQPRR